LAGTEAGQQGGPVRSGADRLAGALSAGRVATDQEPLEYANLAIRGRLALPIIREQLRPALELRPDLVSIVAGGNNALRANVDIDATTALLERGVVAIRSAPKRPLSTPMPPALATPGPPPVRDAEHGQPSDERAKLASSSRRNAECLG
jgi:hypothetical protein